MIKLHLVAFIKARKPNAIFLKLLLEYLLHLVGMTLFRTVVFVVHP